MGLEDAYPRTAADRSEARRRLSAILDGAAVGVFPPADSTARVLAQPSDRDAGVISFTGCSVIFADTDPEWVTALLPAGDLSEPLAVPFLTALGERLGRRSHSVDMLACVTALSGPLPASLALSELTVRDGRDHPRVARALRYRDDVRAWQTADAGGVLIIGRGVAGRWETALEVDPAHRGRGLGTRLARRYVFLNEGNGVLDPRGTLPGRGRRAERAPPGTAAVTAGQRLRSARVKDSGGGR